jgi:hypothetical protein
VPVERIFALGFFFSEFLTRRFSFWGFVTFYSEWDSSGEVLEMAPMEKTSEHTFGRWPTQHGLLGRGHRNMPPEGSQLGMLHLGKGPRNMPSEGIQFGLELGM